MLTRILFTFIYSINPVFPKTDIDNLKLEADKQLETYSPDDKGYKGLIAKYKDNWILLTCLLIAYPFLLAFAEKSKQEILSGSSPTEPDEFESLNDEQRQYEEFLQFKKRYEN